MLGTMGDALKTYWKRYMRINPWTAMAASMGFLVAWGVVFLPPTGERALLAAVIIPAGMLLDYALHKLQTGKPNWQSALITSAIVTVLMPPGVNLGIALLALALAVGSKHFILVRAGGPESSESGGGNTPKRHVFNPAGFGVAVTAALFGYSLGWWPDAFLWLTVAFGLLNVWRVRKFTQVVAYAVVYIVLVTLTAGFPSGSLAASDFGTQTLPLALPYFFMLFMLPEPVTSLQPRWDQVRFGALAALVAVGASYLPAFSGAAIIWGLLAANCFAHLLKTRHRAA